MYKRLLFYLPFSIFFACTTPHILVSDNLKSDTSVMPVEGKRGWQINQVIAYGDYFTSKVKRGWTTVINHSYETRFQKAKNKLSFAQFTPDNKQAEVLAIGKFLNEEYEFLNGFLSYTIQFENSYTGMIIPGDSTNNIWEFIIHNPESSLPKNTNCGMARDQTGNEILIRGVKRLEEHPKVQYFDNYGFEFILDGKSIGAVSVVNKGQVWIHNNVNPDIKLVLSSISTSLLVRHSLQELFTD